MEKDNKKMKETKFLPVCCSSMTLTSKSGKVYWFRTCDIETDLWKDGAHMVWHPAGERIEYCDGKREDAAYSFLGMTYNHKDTWMLDGVNEQGLTGGLLMLNEGTSVKAALADRQGFMGMELVTKWLSSCKDVEEVKKTAGRIQVLDIPYGDISVPATMHYFFTDPSGNEVILEADSKEEPGCFRIYEKEEILGVMTNSPSYHRQKENLKWFLAQSPEMQQGFGGQAVTELVLDGREIKADKNAVHLSHTGTFPASYSSYDRFLRLTILKALNDSGNTFSDREMLALGSGLMGTVYEPYNKGMFHYTCMGEDGKITGQKESYSQYLVMYDTTERCFYIKVFDMVSWIKFESRGRSPKKKETYVIRHDPMQGIIKADI